jgi:hypothetical protein
VPGLRRSEVASLAGISVEYMTKSILIYTAEPGSRAQDSLNLLASWAATTDHSAPRRSARDAALDVPSPKPD